METDAPPTGELAAAQRIEAALRLAVGVPSAMADDLIKDRRTVLRWALVLFLAGFGLFTVIVMSLLDLPAAGWSRGAQIGFVSGGLLALLGGGIRRWRVEWSRLHARRADAVLTRRQRQILLAGIHRGSQLNRTPLPLLTELAHWRIASERADLALFLGYLSAYAVPRLFETDNAGPASAVGSAIGVVVLVVLVILTERERARCRRFLADSADW